jgi:hypothetical protein
MMRYLRLEHRFVKHIPEKLEPGVLYVSVEYGSAAHSCCCGCGEEVVTPITPTDWKITYDGESISLWPSIGNWNLACRSHYIIERGRVNEALPWTNEQIAAERRRDQTAKARHYGTPLPAQPSIPGPPTPAPTPAPEKKPIGRWGRFTRWLSNLFG